MNWVAWSAVFYVGLAISPLLAALLAGEIRRRIVFGTWNS